MSITFCPNLCIDLWNLIELMDFTLLDEPDLFSHAGPGAGNQNIPPFLFRQPWKPQTTQGFFLGLSSNSLLDHPHSKIVVLTNKDIYTGIFDILSSSFMKWVGADVSLKQARVSLFYPLLANATKGSIQAKRKRIVDCIVGEI